MRRVDRTTEQGTPEWHLLRSQHIGASDVAAILGLSPYKSAYSLWKERVGGPKPTSNSNMAYGRAMESTIRSLLEADCGETFTPALVFNTDVPYLMASLDGLTVDDSISAEMKTANAVDHAIAVSGKIPEKYYPQCQSQMLVLEHEFMFYVSYHKGDKQIVTVKRDDQFIEMMKPKIKHFWEVNINQLIAPEQLRKSKNGKNNELSAI